MTSTEIAVRQPGAMITERDVVDGWVEMVGQTAKLADYIAETDFVPKGLRNKPAAIAACILTGRELGIGPMASLKSIHMVQGTPSLSAEYKRARALAAGHQIVIDESTGSRCVVRGRRSGSETWVTITWTTDHAKRAKLAGKDIWQMYPQRMLQARATSELCDLLFPDATLGLPTTEELEDDGEAPAGTVTETPAANGQAPKPARTARRKPQEPADRPTGAPSAAASEGATRDRQRPAPAATARSGQPSLQPTEMIPVGTEHAGLPPLPGEDEATDSVAAATENDAPDDTDYDTPGTVGREQLTAMWATLSSDLGFTKDDKPEARGVCEKIIGRKLLGGTTGNLSRNEASACIDTLKRCRTRERLIVLMNDGELPADEPGGGGHG